MGSKQVVRVTLLKSQNLVAKSKYATVKIEWAKAQLDKWQAYIDANPYDEVTDRITLKETKNGGVIPITSASIEQQQKNQRDTMKEFLDLLAQVQRLEKDEEVASTEMYGGAKVSPRMKTNDGRKDDD
jgi:hypothetical protein